MQSTTASVYVVVCSGVVCPRGWWGRQRRRIEDHPEDRGVPEEEPRRNLMGELSPPAMDIIPKGVVEEPAGIFDQREVVLDPAGMEFVLGGSGRARGASRAIYDLIGVPREEGLPAQVKDKLKTAGEAAAYCYPRRTVIHVLGPNFNMGKWQHGVATKSPTYTACMRFPQIKNCCSHGVAQY